MLKGPLLSASPFPNPIMCLISNILMLIGRNVYKADGLLMGTSLISNILMLIGRNV